MGEQIVETYLNHARLDNELIEVQKADESFIQFKSEILFNCEIFKISLKLDLIMSLKHFKCEQHEFQLPHHPQMNNR